MGASKSINYYKIPMIKVIVLKEGAIVRNKARSKDDILEVTHAEYIAKEADLKIVSDDNPTPKRKVTKTVKTKRTK